MLINSATHIFGISPNRDGMGSEPCDSRNVAWLQFCLGGENWHNNHHGAPSSASTWVKWWQVKRLHGACASSRASCITARLTPPASHLTSPHLPPLASHLHASRLSPHISTPPHLSPQVDGSYLIIRLLELLGLAHDVKVELPIERAGWEEGWDEGTEVLKLLSSTAVVGGAVFMLARHQLSLDWSPPAVGVPQTVAPSSKGALSQ